MKKPLRLLYGVKVKNKDKKKYQFWKDDYVMEYHYLVVKNGFICLGKKQNETN